MIKGALVALFGIGMIWIGFRAWNLGNLGAISAVEAAILYAADEEPLPLSRFDRVWNRVQAVLMIAFGFLIALVAVAFMVSGDS